MSFPALFLVGLSGAGIGLLLHIIAIATTEWHTHSNPDLNVGLFRVCNGDCEDIDDPPSELEATQAMVLMGMLAAIAGIGLGLLFVIIRVLGKSALKIFVYLSGIACIAAAVLNIIGIIIYGTEVYDPVSDDFDLGYSFGLCITGVIFLGVSGVLIFLGGSSVN